MKRKGLLKKMIGALCAVALMSMPVTANAASKEDVMGHWSGQILSFDFYENEVTDSWNDTHPYGTESGTLTFTFYGTSAEKTVAFDLWSGVNPEQNPTSTEQGIVIYKITGPGKMEAYNVFYDSGAGKWMAYNLGIITKVDKSSAGSADLSHSSKSVRKCEHNYEWTTTMEPTETADGESSYLCTFCGDIKARQPISASVAIRNNLLAAIKNAKAGATVTFDNKAWLCYPQYVLDVLKEKGDVSLKTDYTYGGINYSFTIPAGSDYMNLEQADFYGFMYLFGAFNGTVVE